MNWKCPHLSIRKLSEPVEEWLVPTNLDLITPTAQVLHSHFHCSINFAATSIVPKYWQADVVLLSQPEIVLPSAFVAVLFDRRNFPLLPDRLFRIGIGESIDAVVDVDEED